MVDEPDWNAELNRTTALLKQNPADAQALLDRAVAASKLNDWHSAIADWEQVRRHIGDLPALLRNIARGYMRVRDLPKALAILEQLLLRDAGDAETLAVQGVSLMQMGRLEEALDCMRRCAAQRGLGHIDNTLNMATTLMTLGRWEEGLPLYEHRWPHVDGETRTVHTYLSAVPQWNPATDEQVDLVIGMEQGSGDIIMMARYLPILARRVRSVTAMVQKPLVSLLSTSFAHVPNLRIIPAANVPLTSDSRHLMYMSILHLLRERPDTVPSRFGYLSAAHFADRSRRRSSSRPAVGISWRGAAKHPDDDLRSFSPELAVQFMERSPHIDFHALSPPSMLPLADVPAPPNLYFPVNEDDGFEVTAALMEEMDLVISVDSAPCHLAGALGVPVWTLLRRHADWRWGTALVEETPWYGSMALLRQPAINDWQGLLDQVTARLARIGNR